MKTLALIFAILLLWCLPQTSQAAERTVLCEIFTSTTCPPCASANPVFDSWYNSYSLKNRVAVIKYHVWWPSPGNDPYYLANTQESRDRCYLLQPSSSMYVPRLYANGYNDGASNTSTWISKTTSEILNQTPFTMKIEGQLRTTGGTVTITVTTDTSSIPSGTLTLHTVITESNLSYTGPNGDPIHHNVMRKMLSGSSGETFTIGKSETKTFNRTITWNSGWDINNCEIVAFVQVSPKWVLQAAKVITKDLFVGIVDKPSTPINFELEQNYPNPFNPATTFRYSIPERSRVLLKIFDMRGKEVSTIINEVLVSGIYSEKWNPNLPSGTYVYTLEAIPIDNPKNRFFQSRKLLILK